MRHEAQEEIQGSLKPPRKNVKKEHGSRDKY
jgi:hypothetical protein